MPTSVGIQRAKALGLDLVLVSPSADPPVCKVIDYGEYTYQEKKKKNEAKKKQHRIEIKEVKFRPNTDQHDYDFKKNHALRFLTEGNKVKATVFFRGREITHANLGEKLIFRLAKRSCGAGRRRRQASPRRPHDARHHRPQKETVRTPAALRRDFYPVFPTQDCGGGSSVATVTFDGPRFKWRLAIVPSCIPDLSGEFEANNSIAATPARPGREPGRRDPGGRPASGSLPGRKVLPVSRSAHKTTGSHGGIPPFGAKRGLGDLKPSLA